MRGTEVLIVEDEPAVARFIKSSLLTLGYSVTAAVSTGEQAVRAAEEGKPDLVLMDVELGSVPNGIEAAGMIRSKFDIPVILVTGNSDEATLERAKLAEPIGFILKPFGVKDLQTTIETTLHHYWASRRRADSVMEQAELRFRELFEHAVQGVFRIDRSGRFVEVNAALAHMLGYDSPEDMMSSVTSLERHYVEPERRRELLKAIADRGYVKDFEFQVYRRDGRKIWLSQSTRVVTDSRGKKICWEGIVQDITERKTVERARSESLARQAQLNQLQQSLLGSGRLEEKLKAITDGIVSIFRADFCRIWLVGPGDICERGCVHADVKEGPLACRHKDKCLRLTASSGRYTHTNGAMYGRIPFGAYKIGRIASGEERVLLTNDVAFDPGITDHSWAKELGLVSFAGYRLHTGGGKCLGVLALFSKRPITLEEAAQLDALSASAAQVIITAKAEEFLKESENRFRLITETIDDVFWMHDVEKRKTLYVSPAHERIWGRPWQGLHEDPESFFDAIHPDDREAVAAALTFDKCTGPFDHEYRIIRPDGEVRHIYNRAYPVRDNGGRIQCYVGVARDVTFQKKAEQALRESEERYRTAIEHSNDGVAIARGTINIFVNRRYVEMFGYDHAEELIGKPVTVILHPDDCERWEDIVRRRQRGEPVPSHYELKGIRKNGEPMYMEVSSARIMYGGESASLAFIRDITGRKLAEKKRRAMEIQLRQAQKLEAIGRLAAGIAHEINTPIQYVGDNTRFLQDAFAGLTGVIKAYDQLLQASHQGKVDPELIATVKSAVADADIEYFIGEIPKAISQSLEGLTRVTAIVRAMKEFSHPGSEEKQSIDLNRAIENTLTVCRNEWKYVAEMVTDFTPDLPMVPCLPGDLNQVILNLVVNAAHAISEATNNAEKGKGTITVRTRLNGSWAEIHISDTGTGIAEEHRSKIFTPFFTTKEVGKGTGQGLAICYSVIVDKHGGTIEFESEVGKGTTFTIRLPLSGTPSDSAAAQETVH